ncbi:MAG: hypothetical protein K0M63_04930 [Weeksellaceae bacterium]|nr:hypothetical protein [Weeksellaceae bacterium]
MKNLSKLVLTSGLAFTFASCGVNEPASAENGRNYVVGNQIESKVYRSPDGTLYREGDIYRDSNGDFYQNGLVIRSGDVVPKPWYGNTGKFISRRHTTRKSRKDFIKDSIKTATETHKDRKNGKQENLQNNKQKY